MLKIILILVIISLSIQVIFDDIKIQDQKRIISELHNDMGFVINQINDSNCNVFKTKGKTK